MYIADAPTDTGSVADTAHINITAGSGQLTESLIDADFDSSADESNEFDGFASPPPSPVAAPVVQMQQPRHRTTYGGRNVRRAPPPPPPALDTPTFSRTPSAMATPPPRAAATLPPRPKTPDHLHRFNLFVQAIVGARLAWLLDPSKAPPTTTTTPHTIFAPSNEAMRAHATRIGVSIDQLVNDPKLASSLVRMLAVTGCHDIGVSSVTLRTIGGHSVTATDDLLQWAGISGCTARILKGTLNCSNGKIHLIDTIPISPVVTATRANSTRPKIVNRDEKEIVNRDEKENSVPSRVQKVHTPSPFCRGPARGVPRLAALTDFDSPVSVSTSPFTTMASSPFKKRDVNVPRVSGKTRFCIDVEKCSACSTAVYATERCVIDGTVLHRNCFKCCECGCKVGPKTYAGHQGRHYCLPHFKRLFLLKGNYDEGFGTAQHKLRWLSNVQPDSPAGMC